jgi:hypothetical protein
MTFMNIHSRQYAEANPDKCTRLTTGSLVLTSMIRKMYMEIEAMTSYDLGAGFALTLLRLAQNPDYARIANPDHLQALVERGFIALPAPDFLILDYTTREIVLATLWEISHEDGSIELKLVSPVSCCMLEVR